MYERELGNYVKLQSYWLLVFSGLISAAALRLFRHFRPIFVAGEGSSRTRGATKVLPKPHICIGNQQRSYYFPNFAPGGSTESYELSLLPVTLHAY
jgi:hypothetical protein